MSLTATNKMDENSDKRMRSSEKVPEIVKIEPLHIDIENGSGDSDQDQDEDTTTTTTTTTPPKHTSPASTSKINNNNNNISNEKTRRHDNNTPLVVDNTHAFVESRGVNSESIWKESSKEWRQKMIEKCEKCMCLCTCGKGLPSTEKSYMKQRALFNTSLSTLSSSHHHPYQSMASLTTSTPPPPGSDSNGGGGSPASAALERICVYRMRDHDVCNCFCHCDVSHLRHDTNNPASRLPFGCRKVVKLVKGDKMVDERTPQKIKIFTDTDDLCDGLEDNNSTFASKRRKTAYTCYRETIPKFLRHRYVEAERLRRLDSNLAKLKAANTTLTENLEMAIDLLVGKKCNGRGNLGHHCDHYYKLIEFQRKSRLANLKRDLAKYSSVICGTVRDMNNRGMDTQVDDEEFTNMPADQYDAVYSLTPARVDTWGVSGLCYECRKAKTPLDVLLGDEKNTSRSKVSDVVADKSTATVSRSSSSSSTQQARKVVTTATQTTTPVIVSRPGTTDLPVPALVSAVSFTRPISRPISSVPATAMGVTPRAEAHNMNLRLLRKKKLNDSNLYNDGSSTSAQKVLDILRKARSHKKQQQNSDSKDKQNGKNLWKLKDNRVVDNAPTLFYDTVKMYP